MLLRRRPARSSRWVERTSLAWSMAHAHPLRRTRTRSASSPVLFSRRSRPFAALGSPTRGEVDPDQAVQDRQKQGVQPAGCGRIAAAAGARGRAFLRTGGQWQQEPMVGPEGAWKVRNIKGLFDSGTVLRYYAFRCFSVNLSHLLMPIAVIRRVRVTGICRLGQRAGADGLPRKPRPAEQLAPPRAFS